MRGAGEVVDEKMSIVKKRGRLAEEKLEKGINFSRVDLSL